MYRKSIVGLWLKLHEPVLALRFGALIPRITDL
jgi:hypothetical protein